MDPRTASRRGRPIDPYVDEALRTATSEILSKFGWRGATVERIAERAGVARTTIYRRHGSVHGVMLLVIAGLFDHLPVPDTGSLRGDLVEMMTQMAASWRDPRWVDLVCAIIAAQRENPEIADAFHETYLRRRAQIRPMCTRAVARGELRSEHEGDMLIDLLQGLFPGRLAATNEVISDEEIVLMVDLTLNGFLVTP